MSKGVMYSLICITSIVGLSIFGYTSYQSYLNNNIKQIESQKVALTYHQDLKKQAESRKNAPAKTDKDIAELALLKSTGLAGQQKTYNALGIEDSDGVFVQAGILEGNGIPYSSKLKSDDEGSSLTNFDSKDQRYWKKVKQSDFDKMQKKAKETVKELNTEDEQLKQAHMIVQHAKDEEQK